MQREIAIKRLRFDPPNDENIRQNIVIVNVDNLRSKSHAYDIPSLLADACISQRQVGLVESPKHHSLLAIGVSDRADSSCRSALVSQWQRARFHPSISSH